MSLHLKFESSHPQPILMLVITVNIDAGRWPVMAVRWDVVPTPSQGSA